MRCVSTASLSSCKASLALREARMSAMKARPESSTPRDWARHATFVALAKLRCSADPQEIDDFHLGVAGLPDRVGQIDAMSGVLHSRQTMLAATSSLALVRKLCTIVLARSLAL